MAIARHGRMWRYSSNAFSWTSERAAYRHVGGRPLGSGITTRWMSSVKPEGRGAVGIAGLPERCRQLHPSSADDGHRGPARFRRPRDPLRVEGGKPEAPGLSAGLPAAAVGNGCASSLARASLPLRSTARRCVAFASRLLCHGRSRLYARDTDRVVFDDVRSGCHRRLLGSVYAHEPGKWQNSRMAWKADARALARAEGISITGRPDWDGYAFGADVIPGKAQAVAGLRLPRPGKYALFRCPPAGRSGRRCFACGGASRWWWPVDDCRGGAAPEPLEAGAVRRPGDRVHR